MINIDEFKGVNMRVFLTPQKLMLLGILINRFVCLIQSLKFLLSLDETLCFEVLSHNEQFFSLYKYLSSKESKRFETLWILLKILIKILFF